jgi:hypothetical protein
LEKNPALGKALEELDRHLGLAIGFYQTLLLLLEVRWKVEPTTLGLS